MELFNGRKLKFRAWNTDTKLLMRLQNIDCLKGELMKKDHILLQFTGRHDKQGEEIYDMDVLLKDNIKYIIRWENDQNGWTVVTLDNPHEMISDINNFTSQTIRLRSYFESGS